MSTRVAPGDRVGKRVALLASLLNYWDWLFCLTGVSLYSQLRDFVELTVTVFSITDQRKLVSPGNLSFHENRYVPGIMKINYKVTVLCSTGILVHQCINYRRHLSGWANRDLHYHKVHMFSDDIFMGFFLLQPSTQESYVPLMPNVLKVFLENGQTKSFKYDNKTTVKVCTTELYSFTTVCKHTYFAVLIWLDFN